MNPRIVTTRIALAAALIAGVAGLAARDADAAPAEEYVPFVTDFPQPSQPVAAEAGGIDWAAAFDVGIVAAVAAALAGAGLFLARRRRVRPGLIVSALAAVIAVGLTAGVAYGGPQAPDVPAAIAVEEGHKPFLVGHATGVQIYACGATESGYGWSFVAPRANLYDANGKLLTTHFGGPTWQANDGSFVVGRVVDRAPADGTIPWLLLEAASTGAGPDGDRLAKTTFVQRLATTGGLAPAASSCNSETSGATAEVPYTADYVFWKRKEA